VIERPHEVVYGEVEAPTCGPGCRASPHWTGPPRFSLHSRTLLAGSSLNTRLAGWAVTLRGPNAMDLAPCRFDSADSPCAPGGPAETVRRVGARVNVR